MEKLIDEQRSLLEEISAQASQTALRHGTVPASAPEPERPAAPVRKGRKARQESNVIDITEAEILGPVTVGESGLQMPRIRPVRVQPPQVRIL